MPLKVGKRRVLADALRVLLPGRYGGPPLQLYRGTGWQERRRHLNGFSWTQDREVARRFAEHWAGSGQSPDQEARAKELARQWGGGVILGTTAPPEAILLMRDNEEYFDEREVVVDPFKLRFVTVLERLKA